MAGGMMNFGIPAYRLPRNVLQAEIGRIARLGVTFKLNYKVTDVQAEMADGRFDAVFIAIGAHIGKKTAIPARDAGKILDAVSFLKDVELGTAPHIGRRVAIYGGGTHAAIWIGNGRVVHALNPRLDIRVTTLRAMTKPFTTFIHTRIPRG